MIVSWCHHKLLPALSGAHVDFRVRVKNQAAQLLALVEVKRHTPQLRLMQTDNGAIHLGVDF